MALNLTRNNLTADNFSSPDMRIRSVDPRIFFAQAEIAPLNALLEQAKRTQKSINVKQEWVEKDMGTPSTTNTAIDLAADTTVDVAAGTGSMFAAQDLIWVPATGEVMRVSAVTTDALTVERAFGTTAAADIPAGSTLVKLASAYAENATSGTGVAITPTMPYNYHQIHRTPIDASRTFIQTEHYNYKDKLKDLRRDAMILHLEGLERQFIAGEAKWDTTNHRRASAGINAFITTHREDMAGALTKAKFDSFLKDVMFNGGGNYVLMASGSLLEALNQEVLTNSNMNITPATKEWGLDVRNYLSPFGRLRIMYARVLSHIMEGQYDGCGFLININLLTKYFIQKMVLKENIQANDADGRKDEYLEECCIAVHNQQNHGFIYNA
jgi:hypothetical protein